MVRVTSAEMQQHFSASREKAAREPITITHPGQQSLMLAAADEFAQLKALDDRQALYSCELPEDVATAIDAALPAPETHEFDGETTA